jgi:hypothetical protein
MRLGFGGIEAEAARRLGEQGPQAALERVTKAVLGPRTATRIEAYILAGADPDGALHKYDEFTRHEDLVFVERVSAFLILPMAGVPRGEVAQEAQRLLEMPNQITNSWMDGCLHFFAGNELDDAMLAEKSKDVRGLADFVMACNALADRDRSKAMRHFVKATEAYEPGSPVYEWASAWKTRMIRDENWPIWLAATADTGPME